MGERLKRVLVVYSSGSGCTVTIARRISTDFIAYAVRPTIASVAEMPVVEKGVYDAIVFGGSMRMGKWLKEAREWLQTNIDVLSHTPTAFFSVGLLPASGKDSNIIQAEQELESAISSAGSLHPVAAAALPGWKRTEGFTTLENLALKIYPLQEGDYRDWDQVDHWTTQIAPRLVGHGPCLAKIPIDQYQLRYGQ